MKCYLFLDVRGNNSDSDIIAERQLIQMLNVVSLRFWKVAEVERILQCSAGQSSVTVQNEV